MKAANEWQRVDTARAAAAVAKFVAGTISSAELNLELELLVVETRRELERARGETPEEGRERSW